MKKRYCVHCGQLYYPDELDFIEDDNSEYYTGSQFCEECSADLFNEEEEYGET